MKSTLEIFFKLLLKRAIHWFNQTNHIIKDIDHGYLFILLTCANSPNLKKVIFIIRRNKLIEQTLVRQDRV
jgi:hypothetical protein